MFDIIENMIEENAHTDALLAISDLWGCSEKTANKLMSFVAKIPYSGMTQPMIEERKVIRDEILKEVKEKHGEETYLKLKALV